MPPGMGMTKDSVHLEADVHATNAETHGFGEDAWIPYLDIHFEVTKDGEKAYKKTGILFPMTAKDGPHYANGVDMAGPGVYHLTYIISPPTAHGLHTPCGQGIGRARLVEADQGGMDIQLSEQNQMRRTVLLCALLLVGAPAVAEPPIALTLQNHKFTPSEIHVKANTPAMITHDQQGRDGGGIRFHRR